MKIYEQELKDGLGELIKTSASIKIDAKAKPGKSTEQSLNIAKASIAKAFSNPDQIDLYYIDSILASIGWNKNDDVFDKMETWKARSTPVDKPFNFMHDGNDIIGHITGSLVVSSNGDIVPYDIQDSQVPDYYDIITSAVIYKIWPDEERKQQIEELIAEIDEGKWYVSMECLFSEFDYAIIDAEGNHKVIERAPETAFLSKHLRAYGGTGVFKDYKVGRIIKNFVFSGKGLVDKPANPRSVILNESLILDGAKASTQTLTEEEGIKQMANENTDLVAKISALEVQLAKANETITELESKADEEVKKSYEEKISALEAEIATIKAELSTKEQTVAELQKTASESSQAMAAKEEELNKIKAEMLKTARANKLTNAGVTSEELDSVLNKFASASEEMFDEIVALYAAKKAASEKTDKMDKTSYSENVEEKEEKTEAAKTPEKVEVVEEPKEPALATAGEVESDNVTKVREVAIASLKNNIFKTTRNNAKASK